MTSIWPRLKVAVCASVFPLLAVSAFLAAGPASAARPATVVPCDTLSLISAISTAVIAGGTQAITLTAACTYTLTAINNGTQVDTNGLPLITHTVNLTINGSGATIARDAGAPRFRLFQVAAGASLTIADLTLNGGYTPDGTVASNGGGGSGGAILNDGGMVTVTKSTIRGNRAGGGGNCCSGVTAGLGGFGGGLYDDEGVLTVISSTIANNLAGLGGSNGSGIGGSGGGLGGDGGSDIVIDSLISGNVTGSGNISGSISAAGFGGGLSVYSATLTVKNSTLTSNSTGDGLSGLSGIGGGIFLDSGQLTVTNGTIASNTVGSGGSAGGIASLNSGALLQNTLLVANTGGN